MLVPQTPEQEQLLTRLRRHLAILSAHSQFTARLARENKWSPEFAAAVVEEYARFLFIAREGGHPVSPSPIVDKAWHLHLLYTKEYWSDLCPNILGFNLDHSPHTGASADGEKFAEWTQLTLQSYRKFFGTPNRIWRPASPTPNAKMLVVAVLMFGLGIATLAFASYANFGEAGFFIGSIPFVVGTILLIKAHQPSRTASAQKSDGDCGSFSSCGSSDASSYTGSESGGHGGDGGHGGHSCGGGGHSCGSSCGGGGH